MPVKFEEKSEYQRRYEGGTDPANPPLPSFYQRPTEDNTQPKNGLTREPALQHKKRPLSSDGPISVPSYTAMEPPIQRKKKPIQPHGTSPVKKPSVQQNGEEVWKSGEEYVLLGNQDKFTANIKYKAKPIPVRKSVEEDTAADTPQAPRPQPPPAPKVSVDTGAPSKAKKNNKAHNNLKQHEEPKPLVESTGQQEQQSIPKPVMSAGEPRGRSREKQRPGPRKPNTDVGHVTAKVNKDQVKSQPQDQQQQKQQPQQQPHPVTAADSDYALKYKAGIAPPRSKGPKRLSEYQMQYAWKKGVGASPLLDAEQVVYKSSTQLVPVKAEFAKTSEYRKQYQPWEAAQQPKVSDGSAARKGAAKRSKSVDASRYKPAGVERVTSDHDPRLVQESLNPLRLHFPHGPHKKEHSEYASNFLPPNAFSYDQGAWKGNAQPNAQSNQEDSTTTTWFAEVQELRQKAEEYKKRAQGTHFSRQHIAQLLAGQANLWDTASTSSVLSALSLEHGQPHRPLPSESSPDIPAAGRRTAWGQDREPMPSSRGVQSHRSSVSDASTIVAQEENDLASQDGRIPTPSMPDGKRHHLDRTTPLVGGALLTSTETKKSKGKKKISSAASQTSYASVTTPLVTSPPPVSDPPAGIPDTQTSKSVDALIRPTYGKPTPDAHALLDDEASTDRPLTTKFVASPPQASHGRHNRDKFPAVSVPSTIQEDSGATYKAGSARSEVTLDDIPPRGQLEDDVLSTSMRSVASSCSFASEVLERARHRRDEFWGQTNSLHGKV